MHGIECIWQTDIIDLDVIFWFVVNYRMAHTALNKGREQHHSYINIGRMHGYCGGCLPTFKLCVYGSSCGVLIIVGAQLVVFTV